MRLQVLKINMLVKLLIIWELDDYSDYILIILLSKLSLSRNQDQNDPINYRPISLLPMFSNIFEKIVYSQHLDW